MHNTLTSINLYLDSFDWGACVSEVYLTLNEETDCIKAEDFTVMENTQVTDFTKDTFPVIDIASKRIILEAYLTDDAGKKTDKPSKKITLKLECTPVTSSPILFSIQNGGYNQYAENYRMDIQYRDSKISGDLKDMMTAADEFEKAVYQAEDGTVYDYAFYSPQEKSDVLVVWLHGGGEGGVLSLKETTDFKMPLLAAKVTAFIREDFKEKVGDVHILVPQCPTCWLDMEGNNPPSVALYTINTGQSCFTKSLHEMIEVYKEKVGASKVILTGCSNGGYMVMQLGVDYPDDYAGLVMSSEAMLSENITDEQIEAIKDIPMFFVFADNDTTIDPTITAKPTIERLRKAGASNTAFSNTEDVHDLSGKYTDKGEPYQYNGHFSWIYLLNNESVDENGTHVFDWMGTL